MKKQTINKNYAQISEDYQLMLPIDLGVLIPEDDSVRLLILITEELDYTKLYKAYSPIGRNPVVPPKILFKILVYAYMNDIWTSRHLETACKRDINFKWLLQGHKAPDHNTISRFRTERLDNVLDDLFYQLINKLYDIGEIEFKNVFIDGTKIEASANKYTFVWRKSVSKSEFKLEEKINLLAERISKNYNCSILKDKNISKIDLLNDILILLTDEKVLSNIEFVHGKGKRKTEIQKLTEITNDYLERQIKYDMICITLFLMEEIVFQKLIQMLLLCI